MKIFCLVGKSCSGKDTIFKKIIETRKDIIPLITYTTRPKRVYEKNAKEYYFVTKEHFYKMYNNNKVIEHRIYHTEHGDWIYFMVEDGQVKVNTNKKYIVINTLEGAKRLQEIYGVNNVQVIYLYLKDESRIMRTLGREINGNNDYVEMCRRFVTDSNDYSVEKFKEYDLREVVIENEDLNKCIKEVLTIVK